MLRHVKLLKNSDAFFSPTQLTITAFNCCDKIFKLQ